MAIYKGSTAQCLRHFAQADFEGDKRRALMEFAGVTANSTIRRWLNQGELPAGEQLLRMRHYLEHLGYEVTELRKLTPSVRELGRLIAFNVLPIAQAAARIGVPPAKKGGGQLTTILLGGQGVSSERNSRIAALNAEFSDLLKKQVAKVPHLTLRGSNSAGPASVSVHRADPTVQTEQPIDKDSLMKGFAHMVQGLLHQSDFMLSDAFTADDRDKVRQLTGGDGIFLLSNRLNRLCGERARREISNASGDNK